VVSYVDLDQAKPDLKSARINQLIDVQIRYPEASGEDSVISVFPRVGKNFTLRVSPKDKQDTVFFEALEDLRRSKKSAGGS